MSKAPDASRQHQSLCFSTGEGTGGALVTARLSRFPPFVRRLEASLVFPSGSPAGNSVQLEYEIRTIAAKTEMPASFGTRGPKTRKNREIGKKGRSTINHTPRPRTRLK